MRGVSISRRNAGTGRTHSLRETHLSELRTTHQHPGGVTSGDTPEGTRGETNRGAELGASERATRGTDRDLDPGGESKNQGHGPPREERGEE